MFFAFSWVGEFTFKGLLIKGKDRRSADSHAFSDPKSLKASLAIALVSVCAALFLGYYNFAISGVFNPAFPGTDTPHYVGWLDNMTSSGPAGALGYAAGNDRFLYLVLQYFLFWFSGLSPEVFVTFSMPVVLTFLLMLSTFSLVRVGRSRLHAVTAMVVTVFSFPVTVGLYGSLYANWFALTFVFVFYGLLMTVLTGRRDLWLLMLTGAASVAVLYVHPWTWILLVMAILIAYMLVTSLLIWIRKMGSRDLWEAKFMAALLAANTLMFYVRGFLGMGSGTGFAYEERLYPDLFNALRLRYFLDRTFNWYVGGFYAYVPVVLLAIMGVLSFLDYEDRYNRLLLTWLLIGSSMVAVDFPWHARFIYLTPFSIYMALGILFGAEQLSRFTESKRLGRLAPLIFWVFYLLSILLLSNYAVRCVTIKQFGPSGLTLTP